MFAVIKVLASIRGHDFGFRVATLRASNDRCKDRTFCGHGFLTVDG